ncbi:membrane protein [Allostella vacuolata]|nr:membrane protein [Stella vacuolata]
MDEAVRHLAERLLKSGFDELPERERRVIQRIARRSLISRDLSMAAEASGFGARLADHVARFGGSWTFIIAFGVVLVLWTAANSILLPLFVQPFDPYPYIFLNLMLSMLAALQAPVIMMSQNRQAMKDREAAAHDYEVNLKAEIEIMGLHEKLDGLRQEQLTRLLAQQEAQIALLTRLVAGYDGAKVGP